MLEVDFWILDFFRDFAVFGQKSAILKEKGKISEKNEIFKNLLPTFFRHYGSEYLVQISCV